MRFFALGEGDPGLDQVTLPVELGANAGLAFLLGCRQYLCQFLLMQQQFSRALGVCHEVGGRRVQWGDLAGWEVKSLRMGKADLGDSYVLMKDGEAWLLGLQITPLGTASTHFVTDPTRTRKLLLHKKELAKILAATQQKGQTCVCTQLHWKGHLVKARLALATGKKAHDKRDSEKDRDWNRQKQRIIRDNTKQ